MLLSFEGVTQEQPWWDWIPEVLKSLPVVVGVGVAWVALSTWRRQLAGTAAFKSATAVLKKLILLEQEFGAARSPWMSGGEMIAALEAKGESTEGLEGSIGAGEDRKRLDRGAKLAYFERYRRLLGAFNSLHAESVEARVLFGDVIGEEVGNLRGCVTEFGMAVQRADLGARPDAVLFKIDEGDDLSKAVEASAVRLRRLLDPYVRAGLPRVRKG